MINSVDSDISTEEGTLIDHSFRGAVAEFEQAYIAIGTVDQNGYAETADREHLILRAKERGIMPLAASNAEWKAVFDMDIPLGARFSAGELTYIRAEFGRTESLYTFHDEPAQNELIGIDRDVVGLLRGDRANKRYCKHGNDCENECRCSKHRYNK